VSRSFIELVDFRILLNYPLYIRPKRVYFYTYVSTILDVVIRYVHYFIRLKDCNLISCQNRMPI